MIPTDEQIQKLWQTYHFPREKQVHVRLVDRVSQFLAKKILEATGTPINLALLHAAALTHDIDKNAEKLPDERHPGACVRILTSEGMDEVAKVVKTHPLHAILDPSMAPTSWEEKLLFLSDKMVKYDVITVDKRFDLWRDEDLAPEAQKILEESYPKVKELEKEIFGRIDIIPADVAKLI